MLVTSPPAALLTARVGGLATAGGVTAIHADDAVVVLDAAPAPTEARDTRNYLSRVASVLITIVRGDVRCSIHGVDHRLPVERSCTIGAALALSAAGIPTFLTTDHSVGETRDAGIVGSMEE